MKSSAFSTFIHLRTFVLDFLYVLGYNMGEVIYMEINLDNLVPFENLLSDTDNVFQKVDNDGKVVLVKDNRPAYVIVKYVAEQESYMKEASGARSNYTLQEAMKSWKAGRRFC